MRDWDDYTGLESPGTGLPRWSMINGQWPMVKNAMKREQSRTMHKYYDEQQFLVWRRVRRLLACDASRGRAIHHRRQDACVPRGVNGQWSMIKNAIEQEQSQACLSYAEREHFRRSQWSMLKNAI